jgi:hypothetical protein
MQDTGALAGTGAHGPSVRPNSRQFTAVLLNDDQKRASALADLLSSLATPDVRVIRIGSASRSHSMLERILAPVAQADSPSRLAENARLIARTIAERQGRETRVVLLIRQAERLQHGVLRSLQAMAPYFTQAGEPTLQVAFIGRPAFQALLDGEDLAPLRQALAIGPDPLKPTTEPAPAPSGTRIFEAADPEFGRPERPSPATLPRNAEPDAVDDARRLRPAAIPYPAPRRGRIAAFGLLALMIVAAMTGAAYVGLHRLFYRDVPARRVVAAAPPPAAPPVSAPVPAPAIAPAPVENATPAAPPLGEEQRNGPTDRLTDRRPPGASTSSAPDPRPEQRPNQRPDPRVVIHVPVGSASAEALSAQLVKTFGGRPGTVEARRVADTPTRPSIRYFHPEDEPAARQAAGLMADTGLNWTLRDFTTFQPRPSRGTIEVWLPRQP